MAEAKDGVQLLEPWYDFTLELPADALGRAMADVQRMCGSFEAPETSGGTVRRRLSACGDGAGLCAGGRGLHPRAGPLGCAACRVRRLP